MLTRLRGLLIPVVALSLTVGGLAYAAVDDDSPIDVVQDTAEEAPETVVDDEVAPDDQPTEPGESDDEVTTMDDDGTVDDVAEDAGPAEDQEAAHGPERSTEGCPEGFSGNHGQYVSGTEERPRSEAAHSPCGKPVHEGKDKTGGDDDTGDTAPEGEGS